MTQAHLGLVIVLMLTGIVILACSCKETMTHKSVVGLELADMYPKNKFLVRDVDDLTKEGCVNSCAETLNCNAVQYYHPSHKTQANRCRMIRIMDEDDSQWVMSGSAPMTSVVVKKIV